MINKYKKNLYIITLIQIVILAIGITQNSKSQVKVDSQYIQNNYRDIAQRIISEAIPKIPKERKCECKTALQNALI